MSTASFVLEGGFLSGLTTPANPRPLLSTALPRFVTLRGQDPLTIFGADLDLGTNPTIKIGGQSAIVGARTKDRLTTVVPIQPAPGWQPIEVTTGLATAVLAKGVGVLY